LQQQVQQSGLDGLLLCDAVNVRYACGLRAHAVWSLHNFSQYIFVPPEGKAVLFASYYSNADCEDNKKEQEALDGVVGETVEATIMEFHMTGDRHLMRLARKWAEDVKKAITTCNGGSSKIKIAVDKLSPQWTVALAELGVECVPGQMVAEHARAIKTPHGQG